MASGKTAAMGSPHIPRSVMVIGVGNDFRRDDGVGRAVVARLRDSARRTPLPVGAVLLTGDGDAARLMSMWEDAYAAIVVDAARTDASAQPGLIRRFELGGAVSGLSTGAASSHGLGLAVALELSHALGVLPEMLIVYTIESAEFGLGTGLSKRVDAAVVPAARRVERAVRLLAGEARPHTLKGPAPLFHPWS